RAPARSQRAASEKRSECLPGSGETLALSELSRLARIIPRLARNP
ncbi:hypothetical protein A2U01_0074094, partial [Trifolium medium]|nr:hypothetical protein [Trifolium medium]